MKTSTWLLATLASLSSAAPSMVEPRQSPYSDYVFVFFTGEGSSDGEQVYLSVSNDNDPGSWTDVNDGNKVLVSNVGYEGIRDPSLIRANDGSKFWIIATDLKVYGTGGNYNTQTGSKGIVIWESEDLKEWSQPALRNISPSNAGMTWAPDAIWDPDTSQYLVFWTCNLKGEGWYIMKSYTSDFVTFSTAEKFLSGAGMDCTIALDKSTSTFYRICKNGADDLIEETKATSLSGSWSVVSNGIGSGTIPKGEGPLIFQDNTDPTKWHLFIDDFSRGQGYKAFETDDIANGSWTASSGYTLAGRRHGYVVGITATERANILEMFQGNNPQGGK